MLGDDRQQADMELLGAQLESDSLMLWATNNKAVTEQGVPIEFDTHRFLIDVYNDKSYYIVMPKSAQVGATIWATIGSAHESIFEKRNGIYTFPTRGSIINDFVIPKVTPLIEKNPWIDKHIVLDNQKLKQFVDNFLFYRGAFDERDAISISADSLWSDEYDRSNVNVIRTYSSRLENADDPRWRYFSNPSAKGYGIDYLFQSTDQMHWMVRCWHCNHTYFIDWDPAEMTGIDSNAHTLDMTKGIYVCGKCGKEITDEARRNGFWYPKWKTRSRRGYWINQMMRSDRSANRLLQQWEDNKMQPAYIYNFILGKAYTPADALIDRDLFLSVATNLQPPRNEVYIGVDVGVTKHVVVGTPEGVVDLGTYDSWDSIEALFNTLQARCMVVDAMPDITATRALAKKYPGRVYLAEFDYNSKRQQIAEFDPTNRKGFVKIQRTDIMDLVVREMRTRKLQIHVPLHKLEPLIEQSTVMVRIEERDEEGKGKLQVFWVTQGNAPDHFWFALNYLRVAMMRGYIDSGVISKTPPSDSKKGVYYNEQTRQYEGLIPDHKKILKKLAKQERRIRR